MNADQEIQELSNTLRLTYCRQDWGITNSDPARLLEFIRFCETQALTPVQQFAMVELVLSSINDALCSHVVNDEVSAALGRFLTSGYHGLAPQIQYWSSLQDREEFPIAELLHRLAAVA